VFYSFRIAHLLESGAPGIRDFVATSCRISSAAGVRVIRGLEETPKSVGLIRYIAAGTKLSGVFNTHESCKSLALLETIQNLARILSQSIKKNSE
jgi:hypothetical protein